MIISEIQKSTQVLEEGGNSNVKRSSWWNAVRLP